MLLIISFIIISALSCIINFPLSHCIPSLCFNSLSFSFSLSLSLSPMYNEAISQSVRINVPQVCWSISAICSTRCIHFPLFTRKRRDSRHKHITWIPTLQGAVTSLPISCLIYLKNVNNTTPAAELSKCLPRKYPLSLSLHWIEFLKHIRARVSEVRLRLTPGVSNIYYSDGAYKETSTSPFAFIPGFPRDSSFSYISNLSFKVWNSITFFTIPVSSF